MSASFGLTTKLFFKKYREYLYISSIFIIGIFFRTLFLKENLFFGFEQGRDAQVAQLIYNLEKFPLIGPKTDISGIFHGGGYYYLIAALYFLGEGSPYFVVTALAVLNSAGVFFIYWTMKLLTNRSFYQLLAAVLYSISFNSIIYSRWVSNVSPSIPLAAAFIFALLFHRKKQNLTSTTFLAFITGLFLHFEMLHLLYALFTLGVLIVCKFLRFSIKQYIVGTALVVILVSPSIIFELRHQFIMTKSALGYLNGSSPDNSNSLTTYINGIVYEINQTFSVMNIYHNFYKWISPLLLIIGIMIVFFDKYNKHKRGVLAMLTFLTFWSFPYILLSKDHSLVHFYSGTVVMLIVLVVFITSMLKYPIKQGYILVLFTLILTSVFHGYHSLRNIYDVFYQNTHRDMRYVDQLQAMDYIFSYSDDSFHYDAFTVPYFSKNAWDYLYEWVGKTKYQDKYNLNALINNLNQKKYFFLIIEPDSKGDYLNSWLNKYDLSTSIISEEKFGHITVQVRKNISYYQ